VEDQIIRGKGEGLGIGRLYKGVKLCWGALRQWTGMPQAWCRRYWVATFCQPLVQLLALPTICYFGAIVLCNLHADADPAAPDEPQPFLAN
jgi:hypothetical protein